MIEMIEARIRTVILPDKDLKFIPEVLILNSSVEWHEQSLLSGDLTRNASTEEVENYSRMYGKSIEWCAIIPSRSRYRSQEWESLSGVPRDYYLKRAGYKTLKKAKEVLNAFKQKHNL